MPVQAVLIVLSILVAGLGLVVPMAEFDVDTRVGPAQFLLESDFTQMRVDYTGAAPEYGVAVNGSLDFIKGTGEYQERIGFLKGTAKERTNFIVPYTTDFLAKRAQLNVSVGTKTIPWWVVGVKVPCYVDVELVEAHNVSSLTIDRVYFELRRVVGGEDLSKVVWEKDVSDSLMVVGKHLRYEAEVEVSEDFGKFELFGMVEVTMKDDQGIQNLNVYRSYSTNPKTVTLWTIPKGQGFKIGMTVASMPVTVLGIVLAIAALALVFLGRRRRMGATLGAVVVLFLGAIFFRIGVTELATLVGYPDDLTFQWGFWLAMMAFVPATVGVGLIQWQRMCWPPEEEDGDESDEGAERSDGAELADEDVDLPEVSAEDINSPEPLYTGEEVPPEPEDVK
jgi:hypothetical protein